MRTIVKRPIEEFERFTRNMYIYIYMFNAIARGINKSGGQVNEPCCNKPKWRNECSAP